MRAFAQRQRDLGPRCGSTACVFLPSLAGGGAERVTLNLTQQLHNRGWRVQLVVGTPTGALRDQVPDGIELVSLGAGHVTTAIPRLRRHVRELRPDVVVAVMAHANVAAVIATRMLPGRPRVVVCEQQHLSTGATDGGLRNRILPWFVRATYRFADVLVAVSAGVADDLAERSAVVREAIEVVPNPIDFNAIRARATEPVDDDWFTHGGPPVVLGVGRLTEQKDFRTLIRAFARARETHPDARLVIMGDGPQREMLEREIGRLGLGEAARVVPFQMNPYSYMARAAVVALSSRWEGLPTVLLEAAGLGAPIVATDCPSGPAEIFGDAADRLVPTRSPEAFGAALADALERPDAHRLDLDTAPYGLDEAVERYERILRAA